MAFFARKTIFMLTRRLMPRLGEILISAPSTPALRYQHTLPRGGEVGNRFATLRVKRQGADGNLQNHVRSGMSGAIRTFTVSSAVRFEFAIVAVAQQRVVV